MHCLGIYFVCKFPDSGDISVTWLLKQVAQQISANKKTGFYWPNWVETFLKWKAKALHDRKTLGKRASEDILTSLTPENLIIKRYLSQPGFKEAGGG